MFIGGVNGGYFWHFFVFCRFLARIFSRCTLLLLLFYCCVLAINIRAKLKLLIQIFLKKIEFYVGIIDCIDNSQLCVCGSIFYSTWVQLAAILTICRAKLYLSGENTRRCESFLHKNVFWFWCVLIYPVLKWHSFKFYARFGFRKTALQVARCFDVSLFQFFVSY